MIQIKKYLPLLSGVAILGLAACAPKASQLQEVLDKNPEILFSVIEKHPDKFMEVVQKAAEPSRAKGQENAEKEEKGRIENEFKNPLKPEIAADRAAHGPADAPVTIVEYTDFQCPFCSKGYQTMKQVMDAYPGKVRLVYKSLPLSFHPLAMPAAKRFEAVAITDVTKAFKYYDEVFQNQDKLNADGEKFLDAALKKVGANVAQVKKDMESEKVQARIKADTEEAQKFEISGTPGFIINGVSIRGAYPFDAFKGIIDRHLAAK